MKQFILLLLLTISGISVLAQVAIEEKTLNLEKGIGLKGYDVVSYFNGEPRVGESSISKQYEGVWYRFKNQDNLNTFSQNPEKYIPTFGGYCAYAMGERGALVDIDPESFKIINGALYLFYNSYFNNTLKKWNKDEANLLKKAISNWTKYK